MPVAEHPLSIIGISRRMGCCRDLSTIKICSVSRPSSQGAPPLKVAQSCVFFVARLGPVLTKTLWETLWLGLGSEPLLSVSQCQWDWPEMTKAPFASREGGVERSQKICWFRISLNHFQWAHITRAFIKWILIYESNT